MKNIIIKGLIALILTFNATWSDAYENKLGVIWESENGVSIKAFSGDRARPYFKEIANILIDTYKEFPYLYEGNMENETRYLEKYFASKNSIILLVFDGNAVVGFSSLVPLEEEEVSMKKPFRERNIDMKKYFYIGEVIINQPYRGKGILRKFFEYYEGVASDNNRSHLMLMTVERPESHPLRPVNYRSLEPIWRHFGYEKEKWIKVDVLWDRIDTKKEEINTMEVWTKPVG